jgi:hypothetical protein
MGLKEFLSFFNVFKYLPRNGFGTTLNPFGVSLTKMGLDLYFKYFRLFRYFKNFRYLKNFIHYRYYKKYYPYS